ncbi:hypothetical protein Hamer_G013732 [Homarus americanus]|uniref:Uncharacterized protein n=1 Tax=Homarus americanus TaxID=6706 RepID=A0A8J5KKE5_HOMAM|nr:hypothetical protein Hamer_G013732 [Homarus americanus]
MSAIRKTIVTLAKKAGFDEVDDVDVEDLDSHNEDLIELERLQQEEMPLATEEDADETPTQLLTVQNLRKLISSFEKAMEMDPNIDRSCTIIRNVKKDIRAYYEVLEEKRKNAQQMTRCIYRGQTFYPQCTNHPIYSTS